MNNSPPNIKRLFSFVFAFLFLSLHVLFFLPTKSHADEPWLGVGLSRNRYTVADINDVGKPWVWNWGAGNTHGSFPATDNNTVGYTYDNNPDVDFEGRYVPSIYGCASTEADDAFEWITENNYAGPLLVFNEPDNQTYVSCSKNGNVDWDLTNAVNAVDYIITLRNSYYSATGNYVDLILGGPYYSPDWYGFNWFSIFESKWVSMKGTSWPDVQGMHFHLYHKLNDFTSSTPASTIITQMQNSMTAANGWNNLIDNNPEYKGTKNEVWITEVGVLDTDVPIATVNTVMDSMLAHLKANNRIDRVAWYSHGTNNAEIAHKNTALVDQSNGSRSALWNTFQDYCLDDGECEASPMDVDVKNTAITGNVVENNYNGEDMSGCSNTTTGKWCHWEMTSNSRAYVQSNGDLVLAADPGTGYGICWQQWLNTITANGETYNIKGNFNSTFASGKSFFQIQTWDKENYLPFSSTWYTTGTNSIDQNIVVNSSLGGRVAIKFCAYGTETLTARKTATLQKLSVTQVAGSNVSVKDTSITGNLILNDVQWDTTQVNNKWYRWYRNGHTVNNSSIVNGKLVLSTPGTTGDYGSCWIQILTSAQSDGSTYRLRATADTTYGNSITSFQVQTGYNPTFKYFSLPTGNNVSIDETFVIPTGGYSPANVAVKFCTWGTNTTAKTATLKNISFIKL